MTADKRKTNKGIQINVRVPDAATLARFKAAAAADGRSLTGWLNHLANQASLPIRKKERRSA